MANTASVYARIDPELKGEVETILSQLGLTPSAVVQMLYSQIRLTRGIPFEIKLPARRPLSLDEMSREELDRELQKGVDSIMNGRTHSMEEVDAIFQKEYGI